MRIGSFGDRLVAVPAEMSYSAAHEAFVDDPLFALADVRLDEGLPLGLIGAPTARRVRAVLVD
jgi:hypothetical protein